MSEIVERGAEAMRVKRREHIAQPLDRIWPDLMRAAIEAMRVPTEAMLNAALEDHDIKCGLDDCNKHDIPERAWGIMVDAALSAPAVEPKS